MERGVICSYANRLTGVAPERKTHARFATLMPDDEALGLTHGPAPMQPVPASVRNWLIVIAAMIFVMIVIGALTRLTESGLSMVEWRPVTGWLPPLSDTAWQAELQKYLSSPQGRLVNRDFAVAEFKQIFWLEYFHRLWGRVIGVAFALPLAWFWWRGRLNAHLKPRLLALLVLGGLQGALGWAMVASGLIDRPAVSHYRLAGHLLLAVALYAYTVWLILRAGIPGVPDRRARRPEDGAQGRCPDRVPVRRADLGRIDGGPAGRRVAQHLPDHVGLLDPARPVRPLAVVDQSVRERHDDPVPPSLAGHAPGAGGAGAWPGARAAPKRWPPPRWPWCSSASGSPRS